jgi:hypothetical protein
MSADAGSFKGKGYKTKEKEKEKDIRTSNIIAARGILL